MINKIYKIIHNKYSTLFKFIFYIRYLFGIFFLSIVLILSIPHFFDFKKKDMIIKKCEQLCNDLEAVAKIKSVYALVAPSPSAQSPISPTSNTTQTLGLEKTQTMVEN